MEIVNREIRNKRRKVTLHKDLLLHDIDSLSYKLAETVAENPAAGDSVSSDSEDGLDSSVLNPILENRAEVLRKKLTFCLKKLPEHENEEEEDYMEFDDSTEIEPDFVYEFLLPETFNDHGMKIAVKLMHDYLVRGSLMDWYSHIGTAYGTTMLASVTELESKIVDIFREPQIVQHPAMIYIPSYRIR